MQAMLSLQLSSVEILPGDSEWFVGMNEADNKHRQSFFLILIERVGKILKIINTSFIIAIKKPKDEQAMYIYDDFKHVENVTLSMLLLSWH